MRAKDIILKKRQGQELSDKEIKFFIEGYTNGDIPDYQASALAMAICFCGMNEREVSALTDAMAYSGDTVDLSMFGGRSADKHSTGGVGDKTSLIVAPIVASLGGVVAKMSGRGLGHTGGTVDKLESFPGYISSMTSEEFLSQVEKTGIALIGQSAALAPADKKLYALRDATSTVDSIPLIASSIMSKKLAAGAHNIVLDVKVGSGAFMKDEESAEALAGTMVSIGKACGRNVRALITDMDVPLGKAVGNSLEVIEAIDVLKGKLKGDIREICVMLAANMVSMIRDIDTAEAAALAETAIDSGEALAKMKEWIEAQGADASYIDDTDKFPKAPFVKTVVSGTDGYIGKMDTEKIGLAASYLGAGRIKKDDEIDHKAGIIIEKKTGDFVRCGEKLATLFTSDEALLCESEKAYLAALTFTNEKAQKKPLVIKTVK